MRINKTASGILWGGLLGPIGIIVILCIAKKNSQSSRFDSAFSKHRIVNQIPKSVRQSNAETELRRMLGDGVINEDQFKRMQANIYKDDNGAHS